MEAILLGVAYARFGRPSGKLNDLRGSVLKWKV